MENPVFTVVANRVGAGTHDVVFAGGSLAAERKRIPVFRASGGNNGQAGKRHATTEAAKG